MTELLQAAKAALYALEHSEPEHKKLCVEIGAAVERAENPPTDFDKWWAQTEIWPSEYTAAASAWIAAQQAERERIRARAKLAAEKTWRAGDWYVGPQHNNIEAFVEELLRDDDAQP